MRRAVRVVLFGGLLAFASLWSAAPVVAQVLDRIEIVETPTAAEIHIVFNTRALYLRHTPSEKGDLIRVFLDFPDQDRSRRFARELAASPPSDVIPKFTVTFPDQATNGLSIRFAKPVRFRVSQRDIRSSSRIVISVKLDKAVAPLPPLAEVQAPPSAIPPAITGKKELADIPPFRPGMTTESYADDLIKLGRAALASGDNERAVQVFNAMLNLPPNKQSQEAQEMVGVARERNGETAKAKAEYEHYLRIYPDAEGAARVQQRLAVLAEANAQMARSKAGGKAPRKIDEMRVYGSVYEYYYGGYSQTKITDKVANSTTNINNQDQSLLQSAFDVTGRYRKDEYDNKLVVRGTQSYDLLATSDIRRNVSRLRALYYEHSSQDSYLVRVGRQPGNSGGVLDFRFDGAWVRYTAVPQFLNVNLLAGQPRQFSLSSNYVPDDPRNFRADLKRYFYGANVDIGPVWQAWSGNAYYINQMVNGVVDRRAVGTELRYAANGKNAFGLIDYDVSYNVLNVAMLNGTWVTEGTTYTLMADHRRTPYLQTTNSLFGTPNATLQTINTSNESLLRDQARAVTATSDLFLAGVLHSVSKDWQLGGDVRLNRISGTSATNCLVILPGTSTLFLNPNATTDAACSLQAQPGTGSILTYTAQVIGANVPFESTTFVANASYITSPAYRGESLTLNSLARLGQQLQFDTFVLLYHQKDSFGVELYRVTPTVRIDYRFLDSWTFEASGGVEKTLTDSSTQKDSTSRQFFFFGLRWDFS
ncbi:MAG: tetratricopeptide repeat protein [Nitrospirota bacterium]|nr:tetratricopeptide repeat protein [Nitrospirota bacterium]